MTESNNSEEIEGSLILKIGFCAIYKNRVFSSLDLYQYIFELWALIQDIFTYLILKLIFHKRALENSLVRIDETQYWMCFKGDSYVVSQTCITA